MSAIVFVAVFNLLDVTEYFKLWKIKRSDCIVSLVAFIGTCLVGIEYGIVIAIGFSILRVLRRVTMPYYARLGFVEGMEVNATGISAQVPLYRSIATCPQAQLITGVEIFKFDSMIFFGNSFQYNTMVLRFLATPHVHTVVLDFSSIPNIDSQGQFKKYYYIYLLTILISLHIDVAIHMFEKLHEYVSDLELTKKIYFCNVSDAVMKVFEATELVQKFDKASFFYSIHDACLCAQREVPMWYRIDATLEEALEEGKTDKDDVALIRSGSYTLKSVRELNETSTRNTTHGVDGTVRSMNIY